MTIRTRKLFGTIALLVLVVVWSLMGMAAAQMPWIANSGLAQAVFPPDPLCPDTPPPGTFDAIPPSQMVLKASGDGTLSLTLNGAPSQLFGCGPGGALSGTTTLPFSGHVGPKGLLELGLTGNVTGIALPGGSQGGLAASLVLNVDLSGKG